MHANIDTKLSKEINLQFPLPYLPCYISLLNPQKGSNLNGWFLRSHFLYSDISFLRKRTVKGPLPHLGPLGTQPSP